MFLGTGGLSLSCTFHAHFVVLGRTGTCFCNFEVNLVGDFGAFFEIVRKVPD